MKALDVLKRSGRNLRQAKVRTFLTASALAVGGFTLTLTLAAANGATAYSQKLIDANIDPQSLFVAKDKQIFGAQEQTGPQEYSADSISSGAANIKLLTKQDLKAIADLPNVESVSRQYDLSALYIANAAGDKKVTGAINVLDPSQKLQLSAGRIAAARTLDKGQTVLPDTYVKPLGFASAQAALGQKITIQVARGMTTTQAYEFTVVAVSTKSELDISFTTAGPFIGEEDGAAINAFVNAGSPRVDSAMTAVVKADAGVDPASVKSALQAKGYEARTSADLQSLIDQFIQVIKIVILVFGAITLVASFFGVVNTQYISVLERTREIGLMKALGMRRGTVSWLFIIEATWIGFIGALLGSALAFAVGTALNPWISDAINFGDSRLLVFSPAQVVALVLFLMLITTIAGLLPARKAAKLDPIEALRTE